MVLKVFGSDMIGAGVQANLGTTDDVLVAVGATVASTDTTAISGSGAQHSAIIHGTVSGDNGGVSLGDDAAADYNQRVTVGEDGFVGGFATSIAVKVTGYASTVINRGTIWAKRTVFSSKARPMWAGGHTSSMKA